MYIRFSSMSSWLLPDCAAAEPNYRHSWPARSENADNYSLFDITLRGICGSVSRMLGLKIDTIENNGANNWEPLHGNSKLVSIEKVEDFWGLSCDFWLKFVRTQGLTWPTLISSRDNVYAEDRLLSVLWTLCTNEMEVNIRSCQLYGAPISAKTLPKIERKISWPLWKRRCTNRKKMFCVQITNLMPFNSITLCCMWKRVIALHVISLRRTFWAFNGKLLGEPPRPRPPHQPPKPLATNSQLSDPQSLGPAVCASISSHNCAISEQDSEDSWFDVALDKNDDLDLRPLP